MSSFWHFKPTSLTKQKFCTYLKFGKSTWLRNWYDTSIYIYLFNVFPARKTMDHSLMISWKRTKCKWCLSKDWHACRESINVFISEATLFFWSFCNKVSIIFHPWWFTTIWSDSYKSYTYLYYLDKFACLFQTSTQFQSKFTWAIQLLCASPWKEPNLSKPLKDPWQKKQRAKMQKKLHRLPSARFVIDHMSGQRKCQKNVRDHRSQLTIEKAAYEKSDIP